MHLCRFPHAHAANTEYENGALNLGRWQRAMDHTCPPRRMLLQLEDWSSWVVVDGCRHCEQGALCRRRRCIGRRFAGRLLSARGSVAGRVCTTLGAQLLAAENA